jgi:hypothetical protein
VDDGGWPRPEVTDRFPVVAPLTAARAAVDVDAPAGARRAALLEAAPDLKRAIVDGGTIGGVTTGDLITFPYPTAFGLWRVARSPAPLLWLTARFLVVQWQEATGPARRGRPRRTRRRTLVWGAVHVDQSRPPASLRSGARVPVPRRLVATTHGSVLGHLRALGIDAEEVDYVAADHLQGRDLRPVLGSTRPAPDLGSPDAPLRGWFPNATLVTTRREWEGLRAPHPLQAPWYLPETFRDLDGDRIALVDDDVLLGPGAALVGAAGHTAGSATLVLNTDDGVWTSSTNAVAAECYAPRVSRIPGLRRHAVDWGIEAVPNANSPDRLGDHLDAMALERTLADPADEAPVPRCFPLAELTASPLAPGLAPTYVHGRLEGGQVLGGPLRRTTEVA